MGYFTLGARQVTIGYLLRVGTVSRPLQTAATATHIGEPDFLADVIHTYLLARYDYGAAGNMWEMTYGGPSIALADLEAVRALIPLGSLLIAQGYEPSVLGNDEDDYVIRYWEH